jgi:hypothetical protein
VSVAEPVPLGVAVSELDAVTELDGVCTNARESTRELRKGQMIGLPPQEVLRIGHGVDLAGDAQR